MRKGGRLLALPAAVDRWAAVRLTADGQEYLDLSTLAASAAGAQGLALREDARHQRAIRQGARPPYQRVVRVQVRAVSAAG